MIWLPKFWIPCLFLVSGAVIFTESCSKLGGMRFLTKDQWAPRHKCQAQNHRTKFWTPNIFLISKQSFEPQTFFEFQTEFWTPNCFWFCWNVLCPRLAGPGDSDPHCVMFLTKERWAPRHKFQTQSHRTKFWTPNIFLTSKQSFDPQTFFDFQTKFWIPNCVSFSWNVLGPRLSRPGSSEPHCTMFLTNKQQPPMHECQRTKLPDQVLNPKHFFDFQTKFWTPNFFWFPNQVLNPKLFLILLQCSWSQTFRARGLWAMLEPTPMRRTNINAWCIHTNRPTDAAQN